MPDQEELTYRLEIDPKILKLLGPSLYTNMYYILAELIANAYDADAKNVYVIAKPDAITVEDDGDGMSYQGTKKYLNVAVETRTNRADSHTDGGRRKIGRKGVGKLAALSVSENVLVQTKQDGQALGFILSRNVNDDKLLKPLKPEQIHFLRVRGGQGTSIVMQKPEYELNKTFKVVKRNLLKLFPLIDKNFRVHIVQDGQEQIIDSFDKDMIEELGGLIIIGRKFRFLKKHFKNPIPKQPRKLLRVLKAEKQVLSLKNRFKVKKKYNLIIEGWIGIYKSTSGRRAGYDDFRDNFISLLANHKLGEYDILSHVGKNRLAEVYVVGQLHVDLFEETELPDMALSNRQGYKTEDPRYQKVLEYVRDELLPMILNVRAAYANDKRTKKEEARLLRLKDEEEKLQSMVEEYKETASEAAAKNIYRWLDRDDTRTSDRVRSIIRKEMNAALPLVKLKQRIDGQKKRILICHSGKDKNLADVICELLLFNNVPAEDIIYTSCDDETCRIPEGMHVYEYLRRFFVESASAQGIYVLFVTSNDMKISWPAVVEVGAGWITRADHKIFNIEGCKPELPLNIMAEWHTTRKVTGGLSMSKKECDKFAIKIEEVCDTLGYTKKTREENRKKIEGYITIHA